MTIAAFTFTRMLVEKKVQGRGSIDISTSISLISAEEIDFVMGANKQKGVKVTFDYRDTYTPDLGTVIINGEILYLSDQKRHDDLMKAWRKDKKFPDDVTAELYDVISVRATVQAILLTSAVGMPPPIPLPRFRAGKQSSMQQNLFGEKGSSKTEQQSQQKGKKG